MHGAAASTALGFSLSSSPASPTPMGAPLFAPSAGRGDYMPERCQRYKICTNSCNVFSTVLTEPTATAHSEPHVSCWLVSWCSVTWLIVGRLFVKTGVQYPDFTGLGSHGVNGESVLSKHNVPPGSEQPSLQYGLPKQISFVSEISPVPLEKPLLLGNMGYRQWIQVNDIEIATRGVWGVVLHFTC